MPVRSLRQAQRGFLLPTLLIALAAISFALLASLSAWTQNMQRDRRTGEALARAKEALIAYAVSSAFTDPTNAFNGLFGYLPCPEASGAVPEGSEESSGTCGTDAKSRMGRLPWRALGLPPPVDGASECLWYVVSGRYKRTFVLAGNPLMDNDGNLADGRLEIISPNGSILAGGSSENYVVAIVFAPGAPSGSQVHDNPGSRVICPGNFTAFNYLDRDTSASPITDSFRPGYPPIDNSFVSPDPDGYSHFLAGPAANRGVNDRLIHITKDEIYAAMVPFLQDFAGRTATCLAYFANKNLLNQPILPLLADKRLPWATDPNLGAAANYADDCNYNDGTLFYAGRLANRVGDSATLITSTWFVPGVCGAPKNMLFASDTPCPNWSSYIPLWQRWKSLFFYHVAQAFSPLSLPIPPASCGNCVQVNGSGNYAAVILFGGRRLPDNGQTRSPNDKRKDPRNYLEGRNWDNISERNGTKKNYETARLSHTFNDILYCVAPDLSVAPCPLP